MSHNKKTRGQGNQQKATFKKASQVEDGLLVWSKLSSSQRFRLATIAFLITCWSWIIGAGAFWIKDSQIYRSPRIFIFAAAGVVSSLSWLLWGQRKRSQHRLNWKSLSLRLRVAIVITAMLACTGLLLVWKQKLLQFHYYNELRYNQLRASDLPSDLYDYQSQLESLTIKTSALENLSWLRSDALRELTLSSSRLTSLNSLANVPQLQSLNLDLHGAPLNSLAGISSLRGLQKLVLRNLGRAKVPLSPDLQAFPGLKALDLDFERSRISAVPDLTRCDELQNLKLNLRATSGILKLPDMSGLHQVRSAALFLDNSALVSLEPLTALDHIEWLTLSLDGTQLQLLRSWLSALNGKPSPAALTLLFTTRPNENLPSLSGAAQLNSFGLTIRGGEPPAGPVIYPRNLEALTISLEGLDTGNSVLPDIGNLTSLQNLDLDLESSGVNRLPEITKLHRLERLTINVSNTAITELPDFTQAEISFPKLRELSLLLANSDIHSLPGLDRLKKLRTLSLDIRGAQIDDLSLITQISDLENLSIRLRWSQVGDLPDLSALQKLSTLKLDLDKYFDREELPDLSLLPKLKNVTLVLADSAVSNLFLLEKISQLEELQLDVHGSSLESLPDLKSLTKLRTVEVDISNTRINLNQLERLGHVQKLTIDNKTFSSLKGLPKSVANLVIISGNE